jgi:DNA invertase Pin-like site-specific DNA recombinase
MGDYKTPSGRLTEAGAKAIRELRKTGKTYREIAKLLDITVGTVYNVCTKRTWGWLS